MEHLMQTIRDEFASVLGADSATRPERLRRAIENIKDWMTARDLAIQEALMQQGAEAAAARETAAA